MSKYLIILCFLSSLFLKAEIVVDKSSRTVEGQGVGFSRTEAINNAIAEAVGQLNGVSISKETFISDTSIETTKGDESAFIFNKKINAVTKGKIDSYSIVNIEELENGKYNAVVSVTKTKVTKKYKTPGLDTKNRRNIVIVPAYTSNTKYPILDRLEDERYVSQTLTQEMINKITQTRKFNVLDREFDNAYKNEINVLKSTSPIDELLKIGQVMGADYLLTMTITELSIKQDEQKSSIIAKTEDSYSAYSTVQYKIITMATRQVKWSNTISFDFPVSGNSYEQIYLDSLRVIASNITTELMENIYPLKIVNLSKDKVTINQGNIPLGTRYEVFKEGKKIYDSYTKESLGKEEIKIGEIEVFQSQSKFSNAVVLNGTVEKDAICRVMRYSNDMRLSEITEEDKPSNTNTTQSGGVLLPFDK